MDLVAGVRKEGSRGGRDSFKWSDVKESSHRENYLGHSIMAPVGRWQQNRDLNWYAKNQDADSADKAKQEREEEIRRIKEAEQDALALALGLPVAPRASNNANMVPLGGSDVRKVVQESTETDDKTDGDGGRGIGFGSYGGAAAMNDGENEILAPIGMDSGARPVVQEKDGRDRGHRSRRDRSRDRDRRRDREHRDRGGKHRHDRDADREDRHRHHREHREHRRHRSRSRSVSRSPRPERRDRRPETDHRRDTGRSGRHRSSSPRRDRGDHESGRDAQRRHHRR